MRPQAARHSSLVMCVSRSQSVKQSSGRLRSRTDGASLGSRAIELVTVTEGQGALVCGTGTFTGAGVAGAGGIDTETGAGDAVGCAASVWIARASFADLELASLAGCFVSGFCGLTAPLLPVAAALVNLRGST